MKSPSTTTTRLCSIYVDESSIPHTPSFTVAGYSTPPPRHPTRLIYFYESKQAVRQRKNRSRRANNNNNKWERISITRSPIHILDLLHWTTACARVLTHNHTTTQRALSTRQPKLCSTAAKQARFSANTHRIFTIYKCCCGNWLHQTSIWFSCYKIRWLNANWNK